MVYPLQIALSSVCRRAAEALYPWVLLHYSRRFRPPGSLAGRCKSHETPIYSRGLGIGAAFAFAVVAAAAAAAAVAADGADDDDGRGG